MFKPFFCLFQHFSSFYRNFAPELPEGAKEQDSARERRFSSLLLSRTEALEYDASCFSSTMHGISRTLEGAGLLHLRRCCAKPQFRDSFQKTCPKIENFSPCAQRSFLVNFLIFLAWPPLQNVAVKKHCLRAKFWR